jgi:hypothetical protein
LWRGETSAYCIVSLTVKVFISWGVLRRLCIYTYLFIWNNLWNVNYYYFNFFIFYFYFIF